MLSPAPWSLSLLGALFSVIALGCSNRCVTTADCSDAQRCRGGLCQDPAGPPDLDASTDGDSDVDADSDTDVDADADQDDGGHGGRLALALRDIAFGREAQCDLDGNGTNDNIFSSFSDAERALYSAFLGEMLLSRVDVIAFDVDDIEDPITPRDPRFTCSLVGGRDCDGDRSNNHLLDQVLGAVDAYYDGGRPRNELECALGSGLLRLSGDSMHLSLEGDQTLTWGMPSAEVWVAPEMESADGWICGYLRPDELVDISFSVLPGFSMLDGLVSGMRHPDLDLDGDGFERFGMDGTGHVSSCFDGDGSPVETTDGSHCSTASQMADAYSILVVFTSVRAELLPPPDGESCPGF